MTNDERKELEELKAKCIDKRNGEFKKTAETADLERLKALMEKEKECAPEYPPLTVAERSELKGLEKKAREGRQIRQPEPVQMRRLGVLRKRAKVTQ